RHRSESSSSSKSARKYPASLGHQRLSRSRKRRCFGNSLTDSTGSNGLIGGQRTDLPACFDSDGQPLSKQLILSDRFQPIVLLERVEIDEAKPTRIGLTAAPAIDNRRCKSTADIVDNTSPSGWCSVM
ncbi:hypothetical protein BOX15_Mlig010898g1, partial [Macrostomum lignano]